MPAHQWAPTEGRVGGRRGRRSGGVVLVYEIAVYEIALVLVSLLIVC
ncbi:hypothetical protein [Rhodococcus phenolicus]|nr:hypothetical protein [Rhodococcus phenolicus]